MPTMVSNETLKDNPSSSGEPPDCNNPTNVYERAWCSGVVPTGDRLTRLLNALDFMDALGGECSVLAGIGRTVLSNNQFRIYTQVNQFKGFSGFAPQDGLKHGDLWIGIADVFFDHYYDAAHLTTKAQDPTGAPRNLVQILAHELDHLKNRDHLGGPTKTPYSQQCSGLP